MTKQRTGLEGLLKANKVEWIDGHAVIVAAGLVEVAGVRYAAKEILIATGSHPAKPPIPGLELPGVVTSDELLEGEVPEAESLAIIGGGVIGVEFASFYAALGKTVTVLEWEPSILPLLDRDISRLIGQNLKQMGVKQVVQARVQEVVRAEDGLVVCAEVKGKLREYGADQVLVATGRRPSVAGLWSSSVELALDRGFIQVDEAYQTSVPGIRAVGDVIGGNLLAHEAEAEGRAVIQAILGEAPTEDLRYIPSCIYTVPEAASVGLSEQAAQDAGYAIKTHKILMAANARTQIDALGRGFMKLVYEEESLKLLGVHLVCGRASDLIAEFSTHLSHEMTIPDLLRGIRPHPSFAEGVTEALEGTLGEAIHSLN